MWEADSDDDRPGLPELCNALRENIAVRVELGTLHLEALCEAWIFTLGLVYEPLRLAQLRRIMVGQLERQMESVTSQQKHIEDKIGSMQHQIDQQGVQFKQTLEQQLGDQMSRIEALLVKRVRHE